MDPVVREVFGEYVRENPDLAAHVRCLCEAREALLHANCTCRLKADFLDRLRRRLSAEVARPERSVLPEMASSLGYLAAFTSALVVMTVAAMVLTESVVEPREYAEASRDGLVTEQLEGMRFSSLFVAPVDRALPIGSHQRMTPVAPRRMPIAPLWADADWQQSRSTVTRVLAHY